MSLPPITWGPLFDSLRPCREHPEVDVASLPPLGGTQCWVKWPNAWDPDDFVDTCGEPRRKTSALAAPRGRRATLLGEFLCGSIGPYFVPPMKQETKQETEPGDDDQGPDSTDPDHNFGESVDEYEARLERARRELDAAHDMLMAGATIHNEAPTP